MPAHLRDKPYLQPVYDHPQFIVRNVWRRYGGWWDGEPDNLLPSPRAEQAASGSTLAGGLDAGAGAGRRAARPRATLRLACHLVEFAVLAEPDSADAHTLRAEVYASAGRASRYRRWRATSSTTPRSRAAAASATSPVTSEAPGSERERIGGVIVTPGLRLIKQRSAAAGAGIAGATQALCRPRQRPRLSARPLDPLNPRTEFSVSSSQSRILRLAIDRLTISQCMPAPSASVNWMKVLGQVSAS